MSLGELKLHQVSEGALLVRFPQRIDLEIHRLVIQAFRALRGMPGVKELHPAYSSLLIEFDPLHVSTDAFERSVRERLQAKGTEIEAQPRTFEIPVRYGGDEGPDLNAVAKICRLSVREVIALHTGTVYRVFFLGFQPGFGYLGMLPKALETPRLSTPRLKVPKGSIGIAGLQTGIYPRVSPGGWRLIGRTSVDIFDATKSPPTLFEMGDLVRFRVAPGEEPR